MTTQPDKIEITLTFHNPNVTPPPFRKPIICAIGGVRYSGNKREEVLDLQVAEVDVADSMGDEDEGDAMKGELERGEAKWADLQFGMIKLGEDEHTFEFTSDSIEWWAEIPSLPLVERG